MIRPRIFYVAPVAAHPTARALESAAARNKVFGVAEALASVGAASIVVTTAGTDRATTPLRPITLTRRAGDGAATSRPILQVYASQANGLARRLSAILFLAIFALRMVRREDIVLLYNGYPDYLLLALICRVKRVRCILDIEDWAPPSSRSGLDRLVRVSQSLLLRWCAPRQVVVSHQLGRALGLKCFLPVYGAASFHRSQRATPAFAKPVVRILYGGSILPETGLDLFEAALADLRRVPACRPVHVFVSGLFDRDRLAQIAADADGSPMLKVQLCGDLNAAEYRSLCDTIDIGLCLKLSRHEMGQTTFPSKVIEIATKGMLLVSTPVSDVPVIFNSETAIILPDDDPHALAEAIRAAAADPVSAAVRAARGQALVETSFDAVTVGRALLSFLD